MAAAATAVPLTYAGFVKGYAKIAHRLHGTPEENLDGWRSSLSKEEIQAYATAFNKECFASELCLKCMGWGSASCSSCSDACLLPVSASDSAKLFRLFYDTHMATEAEYPRLIISIQQEQERVKSYLKFREYVIKQEEDKRKEQLVPTPTWDEMDDDDGNILDHIAQGQVFV